MNRRIAKKILDYAARSFCSGYNYAPPMRLIVRAACKLPAHHAAILGDSK